MTHDELWAAIEAAQAEVPGWSVGADHNDERVVSLWWATSPTWEHDGLRIEAPESDELVSKIRSFERLVAFALERAGRLDPDGPIAGTVVARPQAAQEPPKAPTPPRDTPAAPAKPTAAQEPPPLLARVECAHDWNVDDTTGKALCKRCGVTGTVRQPRMTREVARTMGFEGDACDECGAMRMVRNGSCLKCTACGTTTGCS